MFFISKEGHVEYKLSYRSTAVHKQCIPSCFRKLFVTDCRYIISHTLIQARELQAPAGTAGMLKLD